MKIHDTKVCLDVKDADLSGSVFKDVNLAGCRISDVNLSGAMVRDANLAGVSISDSALDGMRIDGVLVTELFRVWRAAREDSSFL